MALRVASITAFMLQNFNQAPLLVFSTLAFLLGKVFLRFCKKNKIKLLKENSILSSFLAHSLCFFLSIHLYHSHLIHLSSWLSQTVACRYFISLSKAASLQFCSFTSNGFKTCCPISLKVSSALRFSLCERISMQLTEEQLGRSQMLFGG